MTRRLISSGSIFEELAGYSRAVVDGDFCPADFEKVARVVGRHFADVRPANTTVVSQLLNPDMKIEIEVTAKRHLER